MAAITKVMLFAKLEKQFGKGTISTLSNSDEASILYWTSTGIYPLDDAMAWGLPGGRVVEYFGAESSGKTTALMSAMIENDRRGGENYLGDAEGTFDRDRYKQMGGNPDNVNIFETGTLEEFYDKLKLIVAYAAGVDHFVLIGIDTITMVIPNDMFEAVGDEQPVGSASRVNARHLPTVDKLLPSNCCLLLLSQVRDKIGAAAWGAADSNIDTPGGRTIKHISSCRVFFNQAGQIDNGQTKELRRIMGMKIQAKVVKNKIGAPLRKIQFRIMFDRRGVDNVNCLLNSLVEKKLISAPVAKVYTVKGKSFKEDEFPLFLSKFPKWTAWAVNECYELAHPSIDVLRYLRKK